MESLGYGAAYDIVGYILAVLIEFVTCDGLTDTAIAYTMLA